MDHFNEVMPNKRNGGVWRNRLGDFNSTLSLGLVRMLFQGVMDMSDFLSIDKIRQSRWQDILEKLSEYPLGIAEDGRQSLKEYGEGDLRSKEVRPSGLKQGLYSWFDSPCWCCGAHDRCGFQYYLAGRCGTLVGKAT